ncbi:YhcN/YlaJ family sporulation lipoprotein [Tissierella praeacuta]|uniref:YhcN/YlaJ family sporulation lipoprotein n=1 Tax=Tissierella praeacuta TaxID=43131 RepID=UPI0033415FC2
MKKNILFVIVLTLILQIGCKTVKNDEIVKVEEPNDVAVEVSMEDKVIIDRSENLADYVVELFGVDDAATIIFNDTALVSVVMAYDTSFTEDTKELISSLVMEKDTGIKKVFVSNDEKTFFKTVEIISRLMNGSSYDSQVSEISKMIEKSK